MDELEKARRVWVMISQGRGGTLRKTGWRFYRDPGGSSKSMPDYLMGYVSRIPACAHRLHGVSLECRDARTMIAEYGQHKDVLIYADPPYLGSTRTANQYAHEIASEAEHRELAALFSECRSAVVLSGYPSPLYDEMYAGWNRVEMAAFTGRANTYGKRVEVLWLNRPLGSQQGFDFDGDAA